MVVGNTGISPVNCRVVCVSMTEDWHHDCNIVCFRTASSVLVGKMISWATYTRTLHPLSPILVNFIFSPSISLILASCSDLNGVWEKQDGFSWVQITPDLLGMRWGRWWDVWFPGVQGLDDTWFLKSTLPSIPAGENQLHFDFLMMEAGEGGQAEEFTPGLSLGEQPHLFPAQKPCLWWIVLMLPHLLRKWEPGSSDFYVLSEAGLSASSWQGDGPRNSPVSSLWAPGVQTDEFWRWLGHLLGWRKGLNRVPRLYYLEHELNLSLCCSYNCKFIGS